MALTGRTIWEASVSPLVEPAFVDRVEAQLAAIDGLLEAGNVDAARAVAAEARAAIRQLRCGDLHAVEPTSRVLYAADEMTPAELRVLDFLDTYRSIPEIAAELYVSRNTVKTHLRSIYAKLDASSRAEAVREAKARSLLPGGPRGVDPLEGAA